MVEATALRRHAHLLTLVIALFPFPPASAGALVLETDNGNTEAPEDDPGWANVGVSANHGAVYIGNHWVLTARHVGPGDVLLQRKVYTAELESKTPIPSPDGSITDLILFRIDPKPDLPALPISESSPPVGTSFVMIGNGQSRGDAFTGGGHAGFLWNKRTQNRWGTSVISEHLHHSEVGNTDTFATRFSIARTEHEAQAASGDSGGAAFVNVKGRWELAGIILAVDHYSGQPARSSLYGNRTFIADLSRYRQFIHAVTHNSERQAGPTELPSEPQ